MIPPIRLYLDSFYFMVGRMVIMETEKEIVDYFGRILKEYNSAVSMNTKILGNMPVMKGTRIPVSLIVACFRDGMALEEISNSYNVTLEDIEIALDFVIKLLDFPFQN